MGCHSSKHERSDYADAYLPPSRPTPQQAPDIQPPRPVFNHKKTLSAHIRDEAEQKYGITGPLGNSMSIRGSLKPVPRPGSTTSSSAHSIAPMDFNSPVGAEVVSKSRLSAFGSQPTGASKHVCSSLAGMEPAPALDATAAVSADSIQPHARDTSQPAVRAGPAALQIPEDQAVQHQQDSWPVIDLADEDTPTRPSAAPSFTGSAFSSTSSQALQSDGYFVPGRNTKGSFHGSMQSRGGRSARPSILGLGPDRPPQQAGSRMGSEAGDPLGGPDMARIGTWVASQPGSAACPPAHPQASGRREVDVRRDARKAQEAASVGRTYDLDDLSEEWQAVLHEIDDRLFQTGKPAMDARDRSIAVRSLVESTARESAEAALYRALNTIERSRRQVAA